MLRRFNPLPLTTRRAVSTSSSSSSLLFTSKNFASDKPLINEEPEQQQEVPVSTGGASGGGIAPDRTKMTEKEQALKEKMEAMRQKYATEGSSSDAVGSLMPQDEETKLGYNSNMYFLSYAREFIPTATLSVSMLTYASLWWFVPAYFATMPAFGAWTLGTIAMQRLFFLKGASVKGPIDMRGKVCVVTGASSDGIGRQVAAAFVAAGAEVLISHNTASGHDAVAGVAKAAEKKWQHIIPEGAKERTAEEFERRIVAWPLALEDRLSIVKFISIMKQRFPGGVDVFCNCAGGTPDVGDIIMTKNGFEHHIDTFFLGTLQISDAVQQGMLRKQNSLHSSSKQLPVSPNAKPRNPRLCYLVHPGHTLIRGKNIIGRYFVPSKMDQDWRFSNAKQSHIGMFGLACNVVDMAKHGLTAAQKKAQQQQVAAEKTTSSSESGENSNNASSSGINTNTSSTCGVLVYPGRVASKFRRNTMPSWTTVWKWPLISVAMRTPYEGAQSMVYAATSDDITPAAYVSNCSVREHWKSRTLFNEKLCHDIVEWGRAQLRGSVSNVIKKERAAVAQQAAKEEQERRKKQQQK